MSYKRVVITRPGGVEALQVVEENELPKPGMNEARLRILAAGVARADILMRRGKYPGKVPPFPFTPGYDVVGKIEAINGDEAGLVPGQRAAALTKVGGYSEYICLPVKDLVPVPEGLDSGEVVSLVLNYLTAYQMLHRFAQVQPGQRVLFHAGASGVGTALLQLGGISQLKMYATASTGKLAILKQLGAFPIDYTHQDFSQAIRFHSGESMQAAFDPIGGSHLWHSYQTLSASGMLIAYGELSSAGVEKPALNEVLLHWILPIILKWMPSKRRVLWYEVYPFNQSHPHLYHQDLSRLIDYLAEGRIKPVIAARLPLAAARRAHKMLESRKTIGKIVLVNDGADNSSTT